MNLKYNPKVLSTCYIIIVILILILGLLLRIFIFNKPGGDYVTYKDAMNSFHKGINPYIYTVESFKSGGEHGYAYFPTLLYIQYFIWLLNNFSGIIISTVILWKIPTLICDFLILYLIIKNFKNNNKTFTEYFLRILIIFFWVINPYLISRYDYSLYDPIFLFLLLLSLHLIEKKPLLSAVFYALSISLKTIPIILFPLFLVKTPKKIQFIIVCILTFVVISLPFMRSQYDLETYLNGAFFVHSQRILQGRPFLTYFSYYLSPLYINFFQLNFVKIYSFLSLFLAITVPFVFFIRKKLNNKYSWALLSFFIYLLLTPVLSRTHIIWIMPWFLIFIYQKFSYSKRIIYSYIFLVLFWVLSFFYLLSWNKGFEPLPDAHNRPILKNTDTEWELVRILRPLYFEIKQKN